MSAQLPEFVTGQDQQDSDADLYCIDQLLAAEAALLAAGDVVTDVERKNLNDALWIIRRVRSKRELLEVEPENLSRDEIER